jgi:hypothetical protein
MVANHLIPKEIAFNVNISSIFHRTGIADIALSFAKYVKILVFATNAFGDTIYLQKAHAKGVQSTVSSVKMDFVINAPINSSLLQMDFAIIVLLTVTIAIVLILASIVIGLILLHQMEDAFYAQKIVKVVIQTVSVQIATGITL